MQADADPHGAPPAAARAEDVLGPLEAECMRLLWRDGASAVSRVQESLNARRDRPLAYTTVMTVLARLHQKGWASRTPDGRHYVYRAAVDETELVDRSTAFAVEALLARYGTGALRHFAARLGDLDPPLRAALERLGRPES